MSAGLIDAISELEAVEPAVRAAVALGTSQERQNALLDLYHATPPALRDALWAAVVTTLAQAPRREPSSRGLH